MEHNEPWQVFVDNGQALEGQSADRQEFAVNDKLVMGASHVWLWRLGESSIEVMLQKRSASKKTWPGYADISAAGHIDAGETPVRSAAREAKEEIGLEINPDRLFYIFSLRTPLDKREIDHVYLYEVDDTFEAQFDDGEVESIEWLSLADFKDQVSNPEAYKLVNQGKGYFTLLIDQLQRL